jgi:hypothetical protein
LNVSSSGSVEHPVASRDDVCCPVVDVCCRGRDRVVLEREHALQRLVPLADEVRVASPKLLNVSWSKVRSTLSSNKPNLR